MCGMAAVVYSFISLFTLHSKQERRWCDPVVKAPHLHVEVGDCGFCAVPKLTSSCICIRWQIGCFLLA